MSVVQVQSFVAVDFELTDSPTDRLTGLVIETIVARTQRYVETSQRMVRLVGLSATLPNYQDVAAFLHVNSKTGLFYFGPEYR
jgi:replicative superfamily II helicase